MENATPDEKKRLQVYIWKCLGDILEGSANANNSQEKMINYVNIASTLSLQQSYPTYRWLLENISSKFPQDENKYFQAIYIASQFLISLETGFTKESDSVTALDFDNQKSFIVKIGDLEGAVAFIAKNIEQGKGDTITVIDPYFSEYQLSFIYNLNNKLGLIAEPMFRILTAGKNSNNSKLFNSLEGAEINQQVFTDYWKLAISSQEPPATQINVVENLSKNNPSFHDRYIIRGEVGISLSGSINGLGKTKELLLTNMDSNLVDRIVEQHKSYFEINRLLLKQQGKNVDIQSYTLGV